MSTTLNLDREAWMTQFDLLYRPHQEDLKNAAGGDSPRLTLSIIDKEGRHRAMPPVRIDDPVAAWTAVERNAASGASCYLGVAVARPSHTTGRIKREAVLAMPCLVADLDTIDGSHKGQLAKGLPLPTRAEAMGWVRELPVAPTLVTETGGGIHVWMRLEELLMPATELGASQLVNWKAWWVARAARDERHIDAAVLADTARIMRMAGTGSHKASVADGFIVSIVEQNPGGQLTAEHLANMAPRVQTTTRPDRPTVAHHRQETLSAVGSVSTSRPGDVFNREADLVELTIALLNADEVEPRLLIVPVPGPDGELAWGETPNASIAPGDDGYSMLKIFGERAKVAYDLERDRLTAFDLVCLALRGRGAAAPAPLAARMIAAARTLAVDGVAEYPGLTAAIVAYTPVVAESVRDTTYVEEVVAQYGRLGFTDLGGARLLLRHVRENGADVKWTPSHGFLVYEGGAVWKRDVAHQVRALAHDLGDVVAVKALKAAAALGAPPASDAPAETKRVYEQRAAVVKALSEFARHLNSSRGIDNAMRELAALPGVAVEARAFDRELHLLAVSNGVVDLRNGRLMPHDARYMLTRQVHYDYDPNAEPPARWNAFLREIFPADPDEMGSFLQRLIGYGISGETSEHVFAILLGKGRNGKSVLLETLAEIFNELHQTTGFSTFEDSKGGIPNDIAALDGARLVSASEGDFGRAMSESTLKRASGGDRMSARFMRGEFFEFTPRFLLLLATNHEPMLRGQDDGLWERVLLIRFERYLKKRERDRGLPAKLMAEAPQILTWAVQGAQTWYANGLQAPKFVTRAALAYRESSDQLEGFLPGVYEAVPTRSSIGEPPVKVLASKVFEDFRRWACDGNHQSMRRWSNRALYRALKERGFETEEGHARKLYILGIQRNPALPLDSTKY